MTPRTDEPPELKFASEVLSNERWTPTPLLPATVIGNHLGCDLWLKREDCTPIGSFKLRGALVAMARLADNLPSMGVYVASAGNYGLAITVAGQKRGVPVTVVVPEGATPSKLERIRLSGGQVVVHGSDFDIAKDFADTNEGRRDLIKGMRKALFLRAGFWDWLHARALDPEGSQNTSDVIS